MSGGPSLRGNTADFSLDALLRLLGDTGKTGELSLRTTASEGALGLADGRVVTAVYADEQPIPALAAILALESAEFEFTPWDDAPPANLEGDLDTLRAKANEYSGWLASVREVIPSDRTSFRLSERAAEHGAVTFTADRWRVVLAVNGERDVTALAAHLGLDRDEALTTLASLVRDGVIQTVEPPVETAPAEPPAVVATPEPPAPEPPAPEPPAEVASEPVDEWPAPPLAPLEPAAPQEAGPLPPLDWGAETAAPPEAPEPAAEPASELPSPAPEPSIDEREALMRSAFGMLPTEPEPMPAAEPPAPPQSVADWGPAVVAEPQPEPLAAQPQAPSPEPEPAASGEAPPVIDDRLAALSGIFGPPTEPAPAPPPVGTWSAPAPAQPAAGEWSAPATDAWTAPAPNAQWNAPAPPADASAAADPRLGALAAPPVGMAPAPAPTPSEWSPTPAAPPLEKIEKKKGFLGLFKRESSGTATAVIDQGTGTRPGLLAALANGLLAEYNSGQYGKGRVDERMPSLLMRVDEQADPIDRPLPIVDDRIDVQALDRVALPDEQAAPYLATLVATIYGDAEKTFGRDKAKRGYKLVVHQVFGADLSAVSQSDVAGKLPRI